MCVIIGMCANGILLADAHVNLKNFIDASFVHNSALYI